MKALTFDFLNVIVCMNLLFSSPEDEPGRPWHGDAAKTRQGEAQMQTTGPHSANHSTGQR